MNKGLLNEALLNRNIEKIDFYAKEERKILAKIYQKMEECSNNYKSANSVLFLRSISTYKNTIDKISLKRAKYNTILKRVIIRYNRLANQTVNRFNGDI